MCHFYCLDPMWLLFIKINYIYRVFLMGVIFWGGLYFMYTFLGSTHFCRVTFFITFAACFMKCRTVISIMIATTVFAWLYEVLSFDWLFYYLPQHETFFSLLVPNFVEQLLYIVEILAFWLLEDAVSIFVYALFILNYFFLGFFQPWILNPMYQDIFYKTMGDASEFAFL